MPPAPFAKCRQLMASSVLGNPDMPEISKRGVAAVKTNARRFAANVRPIIEEIMRAPAPKTGCCW
jgi:hypothetical protein